MIKQYRWFPGEIYQNLTNIDDLAAFATGEAFSELQGKILKRIAIQAPAGTEIILTSNVIPSDQIDFSTQDKVIVGAINLFSADFRDLDINFILGTLALNVTDELAYPTGIIVDIVTTEGENE